MRDDLPTAVKTSLRISGLLDIYRTIIGEISDWKVYVVGGALRDSLINHIWGTNFIVNDLDLSLDDAQTTFDKYSFVRRHENAHLTHTGALLWNTPDFDVNFAPFSYSGSTSIEEHIQAFDCDINAIAYDVNSNKLIDCGAIQAIRSRKIEIQPTHSCDTPSALARLIIQSQRLGFEIGRNSVQYVRHKYKKNLDPDIAAYLLRKYKISDPSQCINHLRSLA